MSSYFALMPLPYPPAADAPAASPAAEPISQPREPAADPIYSSDGGVENRATPDNAKRQERVAGLEARSATVQRQVSPTGPSESAGEGWLVHAPAEPLSYEETIAQLEACLQGYRDLDEHGRDITAVDLLYADPPPVFLRRTG